MLGGPAGAHVGGDLGLEGEQPSGLLREILTSTPLGAGSVHR